MKNRNEYGMDLYMHWYRMRDRLCANWRGDFYLFAEAVKDTRKSQHHLEPLDGRLIGPDNFRWVPSYTPVKVKGKELSISKAAENIGITRQALSKRLKQMSVKEAVTKQKR